MFENVLNILRPQKEYFEMIALVDDLKCYWADHIFGEFYWRNFCLFWWLPILQLFYVQSNSMSMLLVRQHFIPVWCAFSLLLKCAWMLLSLNCCSKLWTSWFYRIRCWFWLEDSDCHSCLEWTMLYFLSCSTCSRSSRATKWSLEMLMLNIFFDVILFSCPYILLLLRCFILMS